MLVKKILIGVLSLLCLSISALAQQKEDCSPGDEICPLVKYINANALRQTPEGNPGVTEPSTNNPFGQGVLKTYSISDLPGKVIFKMNAPRPPYGFENFYQCADRVCQLKK